MVPTSAARCSPPGRSASHRAVFSCGTVYFDRAQFCGGIVSFDGAQFSAGRVSFRVAVFSGSFVSFDGAVFDGGTVNLSVAAFNGGTVDFSLAIGMEPVLFSFQGDPPAGLILPAYFESPIEDPAVEHDSAS